MKSLPDDLALLQRCGEALWGDDWRPALRRQFNINPTTTRRWMTGDAMIPRTFWVDLAAYMCKRAMLIRETAIEIDKSLHGG